MTRNCDPFYVRALASGLRPASDPEIFEESSPEHQEVDDCANDDGESDYQDVLYESESESQSNRDASAMESPPFPKPSAPWMPSRSCFSVHSSRIYHYMIDPLLRPRFKTLWNRVQPEFLEQSTPKQKMMELLTAPEWTGF